MKFKTWDEWKSEGYYVIFGEKSIKRNEKGIALFSEEQVDLRDEFLTDYPPEWLPDREDFY